MNGPFFCLLILVQEPSTSLQFKVNIKKDAKLIVGYLGLGAKTLSLLHENNKGADQPAQSDHRIFLIRYLEIIVVIFVVIFIVVNMYILAPYIFSIF